LFSDYVGHTDYNVYTVVHSEQYECTLDSQECTADSEAREA